MEGCPRSQCSAYSIFLVNGFFALLLAKVKVDVVGHEHFSCLAKNKCAAVDLERFL